MYPACHSTFVDFFPRFTEVVHLTLYRLVHGPPLHRMLVSHDARSGAHEGKPQLCELAGESGECTGLREQVPYQQVILTRLGG